MGNPAPVDEKTATARPRLKSGWWRAVLIVGIPVIFLLLWMVWNAEPTYGGHTLSAWLSEFNRIPPDQPAPEVERAIRAIGPRALPFLLGNISADESQKISRGRIWLNEKLKTRNRSRIDLCAPSWRALSILGPLAKDVLPQIASQAANGPFRGRAMISLAVLGTNAIPEMISLCEHSERDVRIEAAVILSKTQVGMRGVESFIAISPFSRQPMLAYNIDTGPSDLPQLIKNLKHENPHVRVATIEAIGSIPGTTEPAREAIEAVIKNDSSAAVKEVARGLRAKSSN